MWLRYIYQFFFIINFSKLQASHVPHTHDATCPNPNIVFFVDPQPTSCPLSKPLVSTSADAAIFYDPNDDVVPTMTSLVPESDPESNFMPFEQWKDYMMKRAGTDSESQIDSERASRSTKAEKTLAKATHATLDITNSMITELSLSTPTPSPKPNSNSSSIASSSLDNVQLNYHPSKDAGKTCKERFSYSSFDAGATVLKTTPGAKNAKAILRENKDSYLLMECATKNKFVIVELSDDILVDTVVIANFEFFSSMVRLFRVSASDRYPVKIDKWVDLGTFEARNSRDIQAFLVENPRIYARYIRLEFLSHYGNEYYCPISLIRVHGTTMIESWKEAEGTNDETLAIDEAHYLDEVVGESETSIAVSHTQDQPDVAKDENSPASVDMIIEKLQLEAADIITHGLALNNIDDIDSNATAICSLNPLLASLIFGGSQSCSVDSAPVYRDYPQTSQATVSHDSVSMAGTDYSTVVDKTKITERIKPSNECSRNLLLSLAPKSDVSPPASLTDSSVSSTPGSSYSPRPVEPMPSRAKAASAGTTPLVQESFFKSVSKRLQYLETNVTWSIRYLEDQAYMLRNVISKAEDNHHRKSNMLLKHLNETILYELRDLRYQYDRIWESTAKAFEAQREQSENEMLAMGARLNVLAEEVVFQKRMSIGQSVLLLSCLVLVIFSRSVMSPPLEWSQNPLSHSRKGRAHDINRASRSYNIIQKESFGQESLQEWGKESSESGDGKHRSSRSRHRQFSPPPSTESSDDDNDVTSPERDLYVSNLPNTLSRRTSSFVNEQTRKPLPALPEHPDL